MTSLFAKAAVGEWEWGLGFCNGSIAAWRLELLMKPKTLIRLAAGPWTGRHPGSSTHTSRRGCGRSSFWSADLAYRRSAYQTDARAVVPWPEKDRPARLAFWFRSGSGTNCRLRRFWMQEDIYPRQSGGGSRVPIKTHPLREKQSSARIPPGPEWCCLAFQDLKGGGQHLANYSMHMWAMGKMVPITAGDFGTFSKALKKQLEQRGFKDPQ